MDTADTSSSPRRARWLSGSISASSWTYRRPLVLPRRGGRLELLDIGELVDVAKPAGRNLPFREGVKHERVIGVRRVGDADGAGHRRRLARGRVRKSSSTGGGSVFSTRPRFISAS